MVRYKPTTSGKRYYVGRMTGTTTFDIYSSYMGLERAKEIAQYFSSKQGCKWIIMKKIGEVE